MRALADDIQAVFSDVPRPENGELLHPSCFDDGDLQALYRYEHWSQVPDDVVEQEYAALFFLSPAGYRHFLPAYLRFCVERPSGGAAALESTVMSLSTRTDRHFSPSRFVAFTDAERRVIVACLEALSPFLDVDATLVEWWDRIEG